MPETINAAQFARLLSPDNVVFVAGSSNEPKALVGALQAHPECARGVTFVQFPLPGFNELDFTSLHPEARMRTFFMTPALREGAARGAVEFVPMQMRMTYEWLRHTRIDVALIQVCRDAQGRFRLGPNADFNGAVMESAKVVVAELNNALTPAAGAAEIPAQRLDYTLESALPLVVTEAPVIDEVAQQIGLEVAALIRDGDCIQTGIGAIPAAILTALQDKNDLGFHGGLIDDGGMALIRGGNVTGLNKPIDKGVHISGIALGSQALHDWLADAPQVHFVGANYTHEVSIMRQLPQFVSINSAVEVDLFGQVNAEVAGGRQLSGVGGSVDFMRGAAVAPGGRSIIAMNATARGGSVSRLVQRVELVTAPRTDIDIVVTEFGVARLKNTSAPERREALIAIAHPDFRDELRSA